VIVKVLGDSVMVGGGDEAVGVREEAGAGSSTMSRPAAQILCLFVLIII